MLSSEQASNSNHGFLPCRPTMKKSKSEWNRVTSDNHRQLRHSSSCPIQLLSTEPARPSLKTSASKRLQLKKNVSFDRLQVRKYPIILGDHPDCYGPPLTIGWEYQNGNDVSIEEYEKRKPSTSRRPMWELEINEFVRQDLLKRSMGVSEREMKDICRQNQKIRRQRMWTVALLPFSKLEEKAQSVRRRWGERKNKGKEAIDETVQSKLEYRHSNIVVSKGA